MTKPRPTPGYLSEIRRRWEQTAGRSCQRYVIEQAALHVGYTYAGFIRLLGLGMRKRSHSDGETVRMRMVETYARKVWDLKMQSTYDGKNATICRAYKSLVKTGQIPSNVTEKQIYRAIERLNLDNESIAPHGEVRRKHPLSCIEIDFTKSVYFHFNAKNEIFILPNYQTKKHESRLWIGAAVDVCTGVCYMEYFMVSGENASFVQDVMLRTFEEKVTADAMGEITGRAKLLQGLPREIYIDRGAGGKAKETKQMLQKLGINRIEGANMRDRSGNMTTRSNKRGRGMVEKLNGDFKRDMETGLWHEHLHGSFPPDVTLSFLNEKLQAWCEERNLRAHPKYKSASRWELFEEVLTTCEYPPDDARSYATSRIMRVVIQRLIQAKQNAWYVAPVWANDGDEVEIVIRGKKVFVYHGGELEELTPQSVIRAQIEEQLLQPNTGDYEGIDLRYKFNEELQFYSDGQIVISKLPDTFDDDKKEFFSQPRNLEEIRLKAQYFVMACAQTKVIHYQERVQQ